MQLILLLLITETAIDNDYCPKFYQIVLNVLIFWIRAVTRLSLAGTHVFLSHASLSVLLPSARDAPRLLFKVWMDGSDVVFGVRQGALFHLLSRMF